MTQSTSSGVLSLEGFGVLFKVRGAWIVCLGFDDYRTRYYLTTEVNPAKTWVLVPLLTIACTIVLIGYFLNFPKSKARTLGSRLQLVTLYVPSSSEVSTSSNLSMNIRKKFGVHSSFFGFASAAGSRTCHL